MENQTRSNLVKSVKENSEFIAQQLRKPSGEFAKKIGKQMNQFNEVLYDFVIDLMQLKDGEKVLEIGFGNGKFFDKLYSRADYLKVKGIDFSEEMVEEAKLNNQKRISNGSLELFLGNSNNLPFDNNSFDKVFCNMVIYFWQRPSKHLQEIWRVLKPSGKFYAGLRTKESTLRFSFAKYGFIFYEPNEWKLVLEENGFDFLGKEQKVEPLINNGEQNIQLESVCFVGEKKTSVFEF